MHSSKAAAAAAELPMQSPMLHDQCMTALMLYKMFTQVQYVYGQESYQKLKAAGCLVEFKTYQGLGHGVDPREVQDITAFLKKHLPSN